MFYSSQFCKQGISVTAKALGAREGRLLKTPSTHMTGILFAWNRSTTFLLPLKTSNYEGRCGSHINKSVYYWEVVLWIITKEFWESAVKWFYAPYLMNNTHTEINRRISALHQSVDISSELCFWSVYASIQKQIEKKKLDKFDFWNWREVRRNGEQTRKSKFPIVIKQCWKLDLCLKVYLSVSSRDNWHQVVKIKLGLNS